MPLGRLTLRCRSLPTRPIGLVRPEAPPLSRTAPAPAPPLQGAWTAGRSAVSV